MKEWSDWVKIECKFRSKVPRREKGFEIDGTRDISEYVLSTNKPLDDVLVPFRCIMS